MDNALSKQIAQGKTVLFLPKVFQYPPLCNGRKTPHYKFPFSNFLILSNIYNVEFVYTTARICL